MASKIEEQTRSRIIKMHKIVEHKFWGAVPINNKKLVSDWDHKAIAIHHSGNSGEKDPRQIEQLHIVKKGWDDVGYHYLIHPGGKIYEGRKIYHKGSHVSGANTGKIGILLLGDYDEQWWDFDDSLSKAHLVNANNLIKTLKKEFGTITKLGGHKEFLPGKNYCCPGNLIMAKIGKMRAKHGLSKP